MKVLEFKKEPYILEYFKNCSWGAAQFLYSLIIEEKVEEVLGEKTKIVVLVDEENVVSFATYAKRDCIADDTMFPWIGFVYTDEAYRGKRYSQKVINYIIDKARDAGHSNIYLATDHIGFYEKYGFEYLESRIDIYDEESRIYFYDLLKKYETMLENYYDSNGLLKQWPSKKPLQKIILKRFKDYFEYNKDYTEKEINEIIKSKIAFNDIELIRRELYNNHILNRLLNGSKYWKEEQK